MTVADLKKKGAVALNDAQLKALLVQKSPWLQNSVTGEKYQIVYGASGTPASGKVAAPFQTGFITQQFAANQAQLQLRYLGTKAPLPSLTGNVAEASYLAVQSVFHHRKIVTARRHGNRDRGLAGVTIVGARSNEFAANYEIIPTVTERAPFR
jgi:hypothetical protein